jgi:hypothetical protein
MDVSSTIAKAERGSLLSVDDSAQNRSSFSLLYLPVWLILSLMCLVVLVRFAKALSVSVGGGDFFLYINIARDWFQLPAGELPSPMWSLYNPGIYRFYHVLMLCGVTSSQGLAVAINSLNLVNALLVTIILWRMKVRPIFSIWAGIWALFIVEHYQGFGAYTEPLVVMPTLLSLAIVTNVTQPWWQGRSLYIVGAGLALSVYAKQQGALYVFGAFCALFWVSDWRRSTWLRQLSILAGVFTSALLFILVAEPGTLMEVLLPKINFILNYTEKSASLWGSLGGERAADPKLGCFLLQLAGALLVIRYFHDSKRWLASPLGGLFALCAAMALATAWQVTRRPYNHYLLLTWPPLIIASAIGVHVAYDYLSKTRWRKVAVAAMLLIMAFPFTRFTSRLGKMFLPGQTGVEKIDAYLESWGFVTAEPWFLPNPSIVLGAPLRSYEPLSKDTQVALTKLRQYLPEKVKAVVMPSHYTAVYWHLNLRHPLRDYGFPKEDLEYKRDLACEQTQAVFMFPEDSRFQAEWIGQARAAGFFRFIREGPLILMMR